MSNWIPVEERLPEVGGDYLICQQLKEGKEVVYSAFYDDIEKDFKTTDSNGWYKLKNITHWQRLPKPPKNT